jgi:prephenate dehydrogenase
MTSPSSRRAHVVGLGLIGASVALALRDARWDVTGTDVDPATVTAALAAGVISATEVSEGHELIVIATPARSRTRCLRGSIDPT